MQQPPWLSRLIALLLIGSLLLMIGPFLLIGIGLLLGVILFGAFTRGGFGVFSVMRGAQSETTRQTFFETTFLLMGCIAKCDGRISEQEIAITEQLMARMGLGAEHRQQAITLFKQGADPSFDLDAQLARFVSDCGSHPALRQMLLMFLFSTAAADGGLAPAEHAMVQKIALGIGFSQAGFEQMLRMFAAQDSFSQAPGMPPRANALAEAYAALGIEPGTDDRAAKQAYRRLMSQYHPDKLIAEGMPEDMVKMATERTQEIQNAWELIRKARGIS
jgi:DnaJ like chaperone protein